MTTKNSGKVCEKCNDTGWVFIDDNTVKECECGLIQRRMQKNNLKFASIPQIYKGVTLADYKIKYYTSDKRESAKEVIEIIEFWLANMDEFVKQGKGLYFWSNTKGSGKTMLAAAIANELINNRMKSVKFANSLDILDAIRETYNSDTDESESRLLDELVRADFLVIDDFGTERVSKWVGEKFYQIVNRRYMNNKVTFFTSNYDLLKLDYDERITSRIRERSFIVHFPEESVREVKAKLENNFRNFKERNIDFEALEKEAFGENK